MNQASGNEELLETARDCFRFITKFFEPINVSAVHIYHSALELSPLSSIVRRLYYHRRCTPFPRIVAGIPDGWEECIYLNQKLYYNAYTWSPCGQFVAARARETVDIWDPLSSELLSTLIQPNADLTGQLAYSPDGHSLASLSGTSLTIWDIQTGGVARKIECGAADNVSLTWSLDGAKICAIMQACQGRAAVVLQPLDYDADTDYVVHVYDVASGATLSSCTLQSEGKPHLWAHNTSFRVITVEQGDQAFTIDTFEVGPILTEVESFHVESLGECDWVVSFSPITYRISISDSSRSQLCILDVRNSECLLEVLEVFEEDEILGFNSHCFSSDGSLFATSSSRGIHIWKYTSGSYALWREFPPWTAFTFVPFPLQFSPGSSSILGHHCGPLQVWRLDGPPIIVHPDSRKPLAVVSCCGTYTITGHMEDSTVTITNVLSPTPSQFIDTDMDIWAFVLTGNVLLVWDGCELVAWRLTERGTVDGVSADRRAGRGDSIWTVLTNNSKISVEDQIVVIKDNKGNVIRVYHTGTGDVLGPAQAPLHPRGRQYRDWELRECQHYPHYRELDGWSIPSEDEWPVTRLALEEGWVKDLEGKHRLRIPVEWRAGLSNAGWLRNKTLLLNVNPRDTVVIVLF